MPAAHAALIAGGGATSQRWPPGLVCVVLLSCMRSRQVHHAFHPADSTWPSCQHTHTHICMLSPAMLTLHMSSLLTPPVLCCQVKKPKVPKAPKPSQDTEGGADGEAPVHLH